MDTINHVTDAYTLTDMQIDTYREQGFIHIPNVLTPQEAEHFRQAAVTASERTADFGKGYDKPIFTQNVNVWQQDEGMKALTFHRNLAAIAERLAGVPLRVWHDQILIKKPHNNAATEFHQDGPYWPHHNRKNSLSAWIALVDVPVERGCMTFIPGTQSLTDLRPQNLGDSADLFSVAPELQWQQRVTVPLRAGDCTFHHSYTAHMATPNLTDVPRVAHVVIYMDADTTFNGAAHVITDPLGLQKDESLNGDTFPRVLD